MDWLWQIFYPAYIGAFFTEFKNEMATPTFWVAVGKIFWINVLLSGDNALVIALACRGHAMIPNLKWSVGQMADGFISLYILSAIIMLYGYLRSLQPGFLILAGLAAGYSVWIKNEGLLFVCVFLVIVILLVWKQNVERSAIKWIAGGLAAPLLITAAYKVVIGTPSDLFSGDQSIHSTADRHTTLVDHRPGFFHEHPPLWELAGERRICPL